MKEDPVQRARAACEAAGAVLITAGAGMGVDSGLPDFRGNEGFWNAYPPYRRLGLSFIEMADPAHFERDPATGWGFYGHRRNLYRQTAPHRGFEKLLRWGEDLPGGMFVFTSNVDGHFQKAGFDPDRIVECHGSILHEQCLAGCGQPLWEAGPDAIAIDEATMMAGDPLPSCPGCGGPARPNILMFGDWGWDPARTASQEARYREWLTASRGHDVVILEFGAGTGVPTVRRESENQARALAQGNATARLIRVNPREPEAPAGATSLRSGALEAIDAIL